jgi:hypothetical protein
MKIVNIRTLCWLLVLLGSLSICSQADAQTMPGDPLSLINTSASRYISADFYQVYDAYHVKPVHTGIDVAGDWNSQCPSGACWPLIAPLRPGAPGLAKNVGTDEVVVQSLDSWAFGKLTVLMKEITQNYTFNNAPGGVSIAGDDFVADSGPVTTNHVHFETFFDVLGEPQDADLRSPLRYAFQDATWNVLGSTEIGPATNSQQTGPELTVFKACTDEFTCDYIDFQFNARVNPISGSFPLGIGGCEIELTGFDNTKIGADFESYLSADCSKYFLTCKVLGGYIPYHFKWTRDQFPAGGFDTENIKEVTVTIYNSKLQGSVTHVFKSVITTQLLAEMAAIPRPDGSVDLRWQMSQEAGIAKVSVYRINEGVSTKIHSISTIIEPGIDYSFTDTSPPAFWTQMVYRVRVENEAISADVGQVSVTRIPAPFSLSVSPNPLIVSSSPARLIVQAGAGGALEVAVFDVAGRLVRRLYAKNMERESAAIQWDGRDESGASVARGVYFVKARLNSDTLTRKVVLLR